MARAKGPSDGRSVVITGVTRGLGRALAEGMARAGHWVVGCGRTAEAIGHLRRELGHPHDLAELDVTHDHSVKAWAGRVVAEHGPPGDRPGTSRRGFVLTEAMKRDPALSFIKGSWHVVRPA